MSSGQIITPDDPELGGIEQLGDNSGLSTLYPEAKKQWEGEIMSTEERAAKKERERQDIIKSIRMKFVPIGLLMPLPFLAAALIASLAFTFTNDSNVSFMVFPMLISFGIWVAVAVTAIRKLFHIFYEHSLSAWPFYIVSLVLLGVSVQTLFILTIPLHAFNGLAATLTIGAGVWVLSVPLSLILLTILSSRGGNTVKLGSVGLLAIVFVGVAAAVSLL